MSENSNGKFFDNAKKKIKNTFDKMSKDNQEKSDAADLNNDSKNDNQNTHPNNDQVTPEDFLDGIEKEKSPLEELEIQLEIEKQRSGELQDKYLRLYSDFENFRKRTSSERIELIQSANKSLMVDKVLPLFDDFERGLSAANKSANIESILEGLNLIQHKFKKILEEQGIKEIDTHGQEFNADFHEAITTIPAPNPEMKGKIVDEIQKGFTMNDKVIRFAKVVVGE